MPEGEGNGSLKARVAEHLEKHPRAMTPIMAREMGVTEAEIIRVLPGDQSRELDVTGDRKMDLIRAVEKLGRVHVIASNEICTLEAYGYFGGFSLTGPYFNVQTDTLDMHIRHAEIGAAFAVIKPSHQDGQTTYSIQFFTTRGTSGFKVFLYKSINEKDGGEVASTIEEWKKIAEEFRKI